MKASLLTIAILALTGCTSITTPDGTTYRNTIFTKTFSKLDIKKTSGTNSIEVHIEGFQSEAVSVVKAATEGVATGLAKGIKP